MMALNTNVVAKKFENKDLVLLEEIFQILFPKTKNMPSAREFGAVSYLISNISHERFDGENRSFLTRAIKDFNDSFPEFLSLDFNDKKKLIQNSISNSEYAFSFISKLTYYGVEAMFSDPIYGGNKDMIIFKSVNHYYGRPRPKYKYGQKYDL